MAEIALTAVINKAIDIAGNVAVQEGSRLYWLQEDIRWIEREMKQIHAYLKDVDAKQVRSEGMKNLNKNIRDLAFDVEDVLEAFLPQLASYKSRRGVLACFRTAACIFCHCYTARNFSMEIQKIKRRVSDIDRPKTTYDITDEGCLKDTWDPRRPFLHMDEPYITGLEGQIEDLKGKLIDEELKFNVIAIVGMPGLGKTTLAKKVFKSTQNKFQCSALVYVSQQPNVTDILEDIAVQVGLKKEKWEENFQADLYQHLREKRYMILFDDVWNTQTWNALKIGIPLNSENGSRVILTSRNTGVGRYVGGESSIIELQPLSPQNSWELFSKMVMAPGKSSVPSELEGIGREIVQKCGGVPLAIVVTVGLLRERERTTHRWSEVLNSMGTLDAGIESTLAPSYRDLPIELKPCFLYFGLFPEDHEIFAFQLINMWIAERFIKVVGDQTLEQVGEAYLNNLFARNLIQVVKRKYDGRIRSCRIHDLLHTLCNSVAEDINFFNTQPATTVRRLARLSGGMNNSDYISIDHQTPKLLTFIYFHDNDDPQRLNNFSRNVKFLRVLHIEVNAFESSLPSDIGILIHLTYLGICSRYMGRRQINVIPDSISNLKSLMTLDLQGFKETMGLPTSILKMKQLRHILIHELHYFYDPNPITRSCKKTGKDLFPLGVSLPYLQTISWLRGKHFETRWLRKLTNLRKLGIAVCDSDGMLEVLAEAKPISSKLEKLGLTATDNSPLKFDLSHYQNLLRLHLLGGKWKWNDPGTFPPNLTKLSLGTMTLDEDFMETLKMLPKLKYLKLVHCYDGSIMVCSGANQHNFPQLEVLKLQWLRYLEELVVDEGGMPRLNTFTIKMCPSLRNLPERLRNMMIEEQPAFEGAEGSYYGGSFTGDRAYAGSGENGPASQLMLCYT